MVQTLAGPQNRADTKAINAKQKVRFDYHAPAGDSRRTIEPYLLVFQWSSWYVWGYCLKRNDFRLFKLNRINRLSCMEEAYTPRERPRFKLDLDTLKALLYTLSLSYIRR